MSLREKLFTPVRKAAMPLTLAAAAILGGGSDISAQQTDTVRVQRGESAVTWERTDENVIPFNIYTQSDGKWQFAADLTAKASPGAERKLTIAGNPAALGHMQPTIAGPRYNWPAELPSELHNSRANIEIPIQDGDIAFCSPDQNMRLGIYVAGTDPNGRYANLDLPGVGTQKCRIYDLGYLNDVPAIIQDGDAHWPGFAGAWQSDTRGNKVGDSMYGSFTITRDDFTGARGSVVARTAADSTSTGTGSASTTGGTSGDGTTGGDDNRPETGDGDGSRWNANIRAGYIHGLSSSNTAMTSGGPSEWETDHDWKGFTIAGDANSQNLTGAFSAAKYSGKNVSQEEFGTTVDATATDISAYVAARLGLGEEGGIGVGAFGRSFGYDLSTINGRDIKHDYGFIGPNIRVGGDSGSFELTVGPAWGNLGIEIAGGEDLSQKMTGIGVSGTIRSQGWNLGDKGKWQLGFDAEGNYSSLGSGSINGLSSENPIEMSLGELGGRLWVGRDNGLSGYVGVTFEHLNREFNTFLPGSVSDYESTTGLPSEWRVNDTHSRSGPKLTIGLQYNW